MKVCGVGRTFGVSRCVWRVACRSQPAGTGKGNAPELPEGSVKIPDSPFDHARLSRTRLSVSVTQVCHRRSFLRTEFVQSVQQFQSKPSNSLSHEQQEFQEEKGSRGTLPESRVLESISSILMQLLVSVNHFPSRPPRPRKRHRTAISAAIAAAVAAAPLPATTTTARAPIAPAHRRRRTTTTTTTTSPTRRRTSARWPTSLPTL
jgi:hypothetical protein